MRGSTRKRGSSWTALWSDQDAQTGKRRQRSQGGFPTRKAAERHLATVLSSIGAGTYVEPSKELLGRYVMDEWLPAIAATVRPSTHDTYTSLARKHLAGRSIGAVPLRALTGAHITALYVELEQDGLAVNSRRLIHSILHRALRDAVRWDKLTRNPAALADPPAAPRSRVQAWTATELRRFLEHVRDDRLYALWRLAATTGMRRGELLAVSHLALDLDAARLRVDRQLRADGCFGPPKSRRSERVVALDPETVVVLRRHLELQSFERGLAGPVYEDGDLVFANELGRPIPPGTLSDRFVSHRKAAGIPVGTLHVLRHTSATLALTATPPVPLHVVAGRLGDDPKTVLATYAHLLPHSDEQAAVTIAAMLSVDKPLTDRPLTGAGLQG